MISRSDLAGVVVFSRTGKKYVRKRNREISSSDLLVFFFSSLKKKIEKITDKNMLQGPFYGTPRVLEVKKYD